MNKFLLAGVLATIIVIITGITIANQSEFKSSQNSQDVSEVQNIEKNPTVNQEKMFGPTDSVQKQLGLIDESGREMFTPTEDVRSQLKLP